MEKQNGALKKKFIYFYLSVCLFVCLLLRVLFCFVCLFVLFVILKQIFTGATC